MLPVDFGGVEFGEAVNCRGESVGVGMLMSVPLSA